VNPLRRASRVGGFGILTLAYGGGFALASGALQKKSASGDAQRIVRDEWVKRWSNALLDLFAIDVRLRGVVPACSNGLLVVANHRSTIDIGVLLRLFGGRMVSRADVATWPIVGRAAASVGTIFVDRQNMMSGMTTVRAMRRCLEERDTLSVFPEGATFADDVVHPFHQGAFVAATHSGAMIVPVALAYQGAASFVNETFAQHLMRMAEASRTTVGVAIGTPFECDARGAELTRYAHRQVSDLVRIARDIAEAPR
jgi:1-acyl-sn-glycerol-3-phosphate acyltransferase